MQKIIISLICCLLPAFALADTLAIRDNAPDRYVVVKGDTLWDISAKFFTDPWKWPEIWGLNKETVKNPHWIYPGDVIVLDRAAKMLRVESAPAAPLAPEAVLEAPAKPEEAPVAEAPKAPEEVAEVKRPEIEGAEKLSPRVRVVPSDHDAISSIPLRDIEPFLKRPLLVENSELGDAPTIISGLEGRQLLSTGDIIYVKNLPSDKGLTWQIYRAGKALTDPESGKMIGREALYLGDARVEKFGDVSTLRITKVKEEIYLGDHLVQTASGFPDNFIPRAPDKAIAARVMAVVNGVSMTGKNSVVIINRGGNDGIQNGHVLALYRTGGKAKDPGEWTYHTLPNRRYGLLLVFRTFKKVSYALVMQTQLPVELMDTAQTP